MRVTIGGTYGARSRRASVGSFDVTRESGCIHRCVRAYPISFTTSLQKTQLQAKSRRSQCCCVFRVSTSIDSVRCLKKWSLSGDLPVTHPIVPRVVRSLSRLSSNEREEYDLDKGQKASRFSITIHRTLEVFEKCTIDRSSTHVIPSLPSSEQSPRRRQAGHFVETHSLPPSCGRRRSQLPRQRVPVALRLATRRAHSRRFLPS